MSEDHSILTFSTRWPSEACLCAVADVPVPPLRAGPAVHAGAVGALGR